MAWKQKLDEEEKEIERLEKEAVHDVASRRASTVNDSIMSGETDARHTTYYCYYPCRDHSNTCWNSLPTSCESRTLHSDNFYKHSKRIYLVTLTAAAPSDSVFCVLCINWLSYLLTYYRKNCCSAGVLYKKHCPISTATPGAVVSARIQKTRRTAALLLIA